MYTLESLLHLGNPTKEQANILNYMLDKGYKRCNKHSKRARSYTR